MSGSISAERTLIWILTAGVFGIINTEMGVVGIVPQIAERFNVSVPEAGLTVSVFALAVALSAPLLPLLCSRFERRSLMVLTMVGFTVCSLALCFTDDFYLMLVWRALPAFLHPVFVSLAFTLAASAVPPEHSSRAVALVFSGVSAGMVLGVPLTSLVAVHFSYEAAMLLFAGVNFTVLIAVLVWVKPMPGTPRPLGSQLRVLRRLSLWFAFLGFALINGAMFGFFSYMTDFLNQVSQMSFDSAALVLLGYGSCNIVGNLLGGRYFPRHRSFYLLCLPLLMLVLYLVLYAGGSNSLLSLSLILLLGLCAGFINIAGQYLISSCATESPDFANGLFLTAANLGTMAGTAVCGFFITLSGTRSSLAGSFIFLGLSLIFVALCLKKGTAVTHGVAKHSGSLQTA